MPQEGDRSTPERRLKAKLEATGTEKKYIRRQQKAIGTDALKDDGVALSTL
jgi:hypothetical protein